MANNLIAPLFCILISTVFAAPSHNSHSHETRRGGHHNHFGWGGMDWDTTKTCADDFRDNKGDCGSFRKCCENLCDTSGGGFQADCILDNDEARLRCRCNGGGGGLGGRPDDGSASNNGDSQSNFNWRPRPRPTSIPIGTETVSFAPARPTGGDKGCGVPTVQPTARIVGGTEAKPHSWPWQISLQLRGRHLCGGSLISPSHILTAAHCFGLSSRASNYKVIIGMHDKSKGDGTSATLSKIYVHPKYDEDANSNDAAIGILSNPVSFSDNVIPICLPQNDVAEGTTCEATGWGDTEGTGNNRYLNQVRVPIISRTVCNDRSHYAGMIDNTMICAGAAGKDSCQGDSGGPLVCQRSDGVWELQGITSWGSNCARRNKPGVYTRVFAVKSWIDGVIKS